MWFFLSFCYFLRHLSSHFVLFFVNPTFCSFVIVV
ncbi:unnamed protein product [Spirodela intermedia]|uniref:Uncharacterized protein n=1 Tax=Spirodela intermedia TaxID=51605 RepID=A0A7I8KKV8_SPIIN|nr:unnamed protein product [Spirodela intermedia]